LISPTCLLKAFTQEGPKRAKRQLSHRCHFALFGSGRVKAARKMLVKSSPDLKTMFTKYEFIGWSCFHESFA